MLALFDIPSYYFSNPSQRFIKTRLFCFYKKQHAMNNHCRIQTKSLQCKIHSQILFSPIKKSLAALYRQPDNFTIKIFSVFSHKFKI